jgi:glycosyltransferase involved in cell wall biosynthesis
VCDSLDIGGAERHVIGLATSLRRRGHDVTIACSSGGAFLSEALASGVAVRTLSEHVVKRRVSISYTRALADLVARARFDLVHAHMHASAAAAAVACARTSTPLVLTEHSEALWRDDRAWRTARATYERAAHVIAVSEKIRRRLVSADRVPPRRSTAIRNAIPRSEHVGLEPDPLMRRDAPGEPIIGVVARLVPEKGVRYLLIAAAALLDVFPRARFVVIGDGPERAELEAIAERLGISSHVRFLGARVDGARLIAELDVLAIPSVGNEGTPLVTLEALSAGVPVVASATGGIPEQLRGFARAALVPPGDAPALTRALLRTLRTRGEADRSRELLLLPGHEAMVRATEAVYRKAYADAQAATSFHAAAPAQRWAAR